jgi:alpha-amylase
MPAVCFYLQVHQPYRLRRYSYFDVEKATTYFDENLNRSIMEGVATRCYLPTNERLLRMLREHEGAFKVAFSISGTAIEQMRQYAPEALESFRALAATGNVEFLGETYHHSLASLYDREEFESQVLLHAECVEREFGQRPRVFRNTELIYNDEIGQRAGELGFRGVLAEGVSDVLGWRSPHFVYRVPGATTKTLLRSFKLSDDIAFRFTHRDSNDSQSLTPDRFATSLHALSGNADVVGLFLDYETFGEHHRKETGILDFLEALPRHTILQREWKFLTPSEAIRLFSPVSELSFSRTTSWADTERDVSAWCGNMMQRAALGEVYNTDKLYAECELSAPDMALARETWRRLQTSDHFYYMSTKGDGDGVVHRYFSPFESPYDAFVAYMNVLKDINVRCRRVVAERERRPASNETTQNNASASFCIGVKPLWSQQPEK